MKTATFRPATGMHPIIASHLDGLLQHRTEREDLCLWTCPYGHNEVVFEGFVKSDGGIRHLVHRYDRTTLHGAALDTLEHGTFSPAPLSTRSGVRWLHHQLRARAVCPLVRALDPLSLDALLSSLRPEARA